jgi:integration host factor subunit alpha
MTQNSDRTMTKADLVDVVHRRTGLSKREAGRSVESFLDLLKQSLVDGNHVKLANFGSFRLRDKAPRVGRNPRAKGSEITISARRVVTFRPSPNLRAAMN